MKITSVEQEIYPDLVDKLLTPIFMIAIAGLPLVHGENESHPTSGSHENTLNNATSQKKTIEVPVKASISKLTLEKYFVAKRIGKIGGEEFKLVLQDTVTKYQSINGSYPPPPERPQAPGKDWYFKDWKQKPLEVAVSLPKLPVDHIADPKWSDLPMDRNPGMNLPDGYRWTGKVRTKETEGTISYRMTAIFERIQQN